MYQQYQHAKESSMVRYILSSSTNWLHYSRYFCPLRGLNVIYFVHMHKCKHWDLMWNKSFSHLHIMQGYYEHTLTVRCNSRPHSCSLTHASAVSHQVVTWITTVVCCLSKCSSCMIDYAISWVFQSTTVHSCKMRYTLVHMCRVNDQHSYITNIQTIVNGK